MRNLLKSEGGNVTIITAFTMPLLLLFGGGALDYGQSVYTEQKLKAVADAAATAGVNEAYLASMGLEDVDLVEEIKNATTAAFNAQAAQMGEWVEDYDIEVNPKMVENRMTVDVSVSGNMDTHFMRIAGINNLPVKTSSKASLALAQYANITLLFDISASMGIGATKEDREEMAAHLNCAFGCHMRSSWSGSWGDAVGPWANGPITDEHYKAKAERYGFKQDKDGNYIVPKNYTNQDLANFLDAKSRLDVSKEGAIAALTALDEVDLERDQVTFTIGQFSNALEMVIPEGDPLAYDRNYVKQRLSEDVQISRKRGGTNAAYSIEQLLAVLPKGGSGLRKDDRAQYVIVLSDGFQNYSGRRGGEPLYITEPRYSHGMYVFNPIACDWMKEKKIKPLFITTDYIADYTEGRATGDGRNRWIDRTKPALKERLEGCVEDPNEHLITADTPEQIAASFKKLFGVLSSPLRLANN